MPAPTIIHEARTRCPRCGQRHTRLSDRRRPTADGQACTGCMDVPLAPAAAHRCADCERPAAPGLDRCTRHHRALARAVREGRALAG